VVKRANRGSAPRLKATEFEFKEDGEIVIRTVDEPKRPSAAP
jgi:hypothetical protein